MITENMGLVYMVAKRFANRGTDLQDLTQIGVIGLIKAIDRFDTSLSYSFSTYAVPLITVSYTHLTLPTKLEV